MCCTAYSSSGSLLSNRTLAGIPESPLATRRHGASGLSLCARPVAPCHGSRTPATRWLCFLHRILFRGRTARRDAQFLIRDRYHPCSQQRSDKGPQCRLRKEAEGIIAALEDG